MGQTIMTTAAPVYRLVFDKMDETTSFNVKNNELTVNTDAGLVYFENLKTGQRAYSSIEAVFMYLKHGVAEAYSKLCQPSQKDTD